MPEMYERPPIAQSPLSLVLLASQACDASPAVASWQAFLATRPLPFEVLLVQPALAEAELAQPVEFRYLPGETLGATLSAALQAAQYPLIAMAPADGSIRPENLQILLGLIDKADLVVGCRVERPIPLWRRGLDRILGMTSTILMGLPLAPRLNWPSGPARRRRRRIRWQFGVHMQDPESPFRLARREAVTRFPLEAGGPFALVEMLAKANHLALLLAEEPVPAAAVADAEPAGFRRDLWRLFRDPNFVPIGAKEPEPPPAPGGDSGNLLA